MIIEAISRNKKLPPITCPVYGRRHCLCPMRGFFMVISIYIFMFKLYKVYYTAAMK